MELSSRPLSFTTLTIRPCDMSFILSRIIFQFELYFVIMHFKNVTYVTHIDPKYP